MSEDFMEEAVWLNKRMLNEKSFNEYLHITTWTDLPNIIRSIFDGQTYSKIETPDYYQLLLAINQPSSYLINKYVYRTSIDIVKLSIL